MLMKTLHLTNGRFYSLKHIGCSDVGAQSAAPGPNRYPAPWCGQWCNIYDVIVLSQPWYDLLFYEDLFARTFAKFSVNCRLLNLPEHHAAGPNAKLQLLIAATWWYHQSVRTSNNYYK